MVLNAYLLLTLATLFWGGNFVVGRAVHEAIEPTTLNMCRWLVALLILLPFAARGLRRDRRALIAQWRLVLTLAVFGIVVFHLSVYGALTRTTAINASLVIAANPALIVVLAWLLQGERAGPLRVLGVLVSLLGVVVIVTHGELARLLRLELGAGEMLMLLAILAWSIYSLMLRRRPAAVSPLSLLVAVIAVGAALNVGVWLLDPSVPRFEPNLLLAVLYVSLFASVLAYLCWNAGVEALGASAAGPFLNLQPVFAAGLAVLLLGESFAPYHLVGAALVFAGIPLATRRRAALTLAAARRRPKVGP